MSSFLQGEKASEIPELGGRGLSLSPARLGGRSIESVRHQLLADIVPYAICIIPSIVTIAGAVLNLQKAFRKSEGLNNCKQRENPKFHCSKVKFS